MAIESMDELLSIVTKAVAKYKAYGCIVVLHTEDECISIQYGLKYDDFMNSAETIIEHRERSSTNN